jgi:hypothetical protein
VLTTLGSCAPPASAGGARCHARSLPGRRELILVGVHDSAFTGRDGCTPESPASPSLNVVHVRTKDSFARLDAKEIDLLCGGFALCHGLSQPDAPR